MESVPSIYIICFIFSLKAEKKKRKIHLRSVAIIRVKYPRKNKREILVQAIAGKRLQINLKKNQKLEIQLFFPRKKKEKIMKPRPPSDDGFWGCHRSSTWEGKRNKQIPEMESSWLRPCPQGGYKSPEKKTMDFHLLIGYLRGFDFVLSKK